MLDSDIETARTKPEVIDVDDCALHERSDWLTKLSGPISDINAGMWPEVKLLPEMIIGAEFIRNITSRRPNGCQLDRINLLPRGVIDINFMGNWVERGHSSADNGKT